MLQQSSTRLIIQYAAEAVDTRPDKHRRRYIVPCSTISIHASISVGGWVEVSTGRPGSSPAGASAGDDIITPVPPLIRPTLSSRTVFVPAPISIQTHWSFARGSPLFVVKRVICKISTRWPGAPPAVRMPLGPNMLLICASAMVIVLACFFVERWMLEVDICHWNVGMVVMYVGSQMRQMLYCIQLHFSQHKIRAQPRSARADRPAQVMVCMCMRARACVCARCITRTMLWA